jgi:hypothetical protein
VLISVAESVGQRPLDIFFSGDGLPLPTIPETIRLFDISTQLQMDAALMSGRHTLVFLPRPLPFTDTEDTFSLRSWCNVARAALQMAASTPTLITFVIQGRLDTPSPTTLPLLDRRFELDILRKFLYAIRIFPELRLHHRDVTDGTISRDRMPTPFPLMMFLYASSSSFSKEVSTSVWMDPDMPPEPPPLPEDTAIQVILNAAHLSPADQQTRPLTGLRLLMVLNGMDPNEASTSLRHASLLRYPTHFVPIVKRNSPDGVTIAHYHVPPSIVQNLTEDADMLKEMGIEWAVMSEPLLGTLLISHVPRTFRPGKKALKQQSSEVRDSLLAIPAVANLLECTILVNKWDVWTRPSSGVAIDLLAAQLRNLDDLMATDAAQLMRISGPMGPPTVSPPNVLASFPARLLPTTVLAALSQLLPITSHQATERPGLLLIRVATPEVASLLYGAVVSCGHGSVTLTSGTDSGDSQWEQSQGLQRGASWEERQSLLAPLTVTHPLTAESLLGLQASNSSGPPISLPARRVPQMFKQTTVGAPSSATMQEN